jgi:hypothetical protein
VELEHDQVVVELEHDQVAVEPVRDHPRALLAVLLRTKLVTGARHPGLAALLAAADSVVAAETTREPAAAEVAAAWAVAVTAVAEAGIAVAVE